MVSISRHTSGHGRHGHTVVLPLVGAGRALVVNVGAAGQVGGAVLGAETGIVLEAEVAGDAAGNVAKGRVAAGNVDLVGADPGGEDAGPVADGPVGVGHGGWP